jgi:SAM-dependent methyltransferase
MRQADIFLQGGEGDRWLERNRDQLGHNDPIADVIEVLGIKPTRVLEIGCANGWRLAALHAMYDCEVFGVEPSLLACVEAADRKVPVWQMTASTLPELGPKFDMIIYGFCLYLTDPSDWFNIVAEGDRALAPGGHLVIHDFGDEGKPFARKYEHREGLLAYHVDFAKMWLGSPLYHRVHREHHVDDQMITVLKKSPASIIEVQP